MVGRKRGLPRWERVGHPLDTLTVAACYAWLVANRPGPHALPVYIGLAAFSCLFVTKDEFVHARVCDGLESWLHAVLFVLHPVVFLAFGVLWYAHAGQGAWFVRAQLAATLTFFVYQVLYWSVSWKRTNRTPAATVRPVNNEIYWPSAPAGTTRTTTQRCSGPSRGYGIPWVARRLENAFGAKPCAVLDIGCGAGFLSNHLAALGHRVTGVDASGESLDVAIRHDRTGTVRYDLGDALALPYADGVFDVVCAMDFLEHVEEPRAVIAEASRVLAPGGLFFFHTFNRNFLAWLVVIKGVEWFVKNTPADMHVLRLFLRPGEVEGMCHTHGLEVVEQVGSRPIFGRSFWGMLATGRVPADFAFTFVRSTRLGFTGVARKGGSPSGDATV